MERSKVKIKNPYGWAASVVVDMEGERPPITPQGLYSSDRAAFTWVEETVLGEVAQEVPPSCVVGFVHYGEILNQPYQPSKLIPETARLYRRYTWEEIRFVWRDRV